MAKFGYGQIVANKVGGGIGWRGAMDAPQPNHGQNIVDYLNQLGAVGWELVAAVPAEPQPIYTLKRSID